MTKMISIPVADIEHLLKKIAFDANTLTVGDTKQAQALLTKINPPDPTLVEMLSAKINLRGQTAAMQDEWAKMTILARQQENKIIELEARIKELSALLEKHMLTATDRFTALHKIAQHNALPTVERWADAYTFIRQIARDALQEKS